MMFNFFRKRYRFRVIIPAYPAFNIYSSVAKITTALGPVCVASVVDKMDRWDAEVIDENNPGRYGPLDSREGADHSLLQHLRPADVVGLYGGLTSTIPRLYRIARFYKNEGVITIAGGQHFIEENIDEALHNGVDYIVIGEGEETIKELLAALACNQDIDGIKGIAYLKNGEVKVNSAREPITDFDKFPLPNFSLVRYANIKLYPVGRVRGCGMNCEFCTVKGRPRYASPQRLLDTVRLVVETRGGRHFFIVDDLFGQKRDETIKLCGMLKEYQRSINRRLDFTVQIRLDKAKDSNLLLAMRRGGINTVAIGFESPIGEELKAMNKHINPEDMVRMARIYHKFGFLVHGMFIFGYPLKEGINFEMPAAVRVKRFKRFIRRAKIDTIQILLPVPLPGTEMTHRLKKQNRVYSIKDIGWEYYDGNFPLFDPDPPLNPQDMQFSIRKIMGKFYQFKYVFMLAIHIISFPALFFFLGNIRFGWRQWYRSWRNALARFGGWVVLNNWTREFNKGVFTDKLRKAKKTAHSS